MHCGLRRKRSAESRPPGSDQSTFRSARIWHIPLPANTVGLRAAHFGIATMKAKRIYILIGLSCSLLLAACATTNLDLPAITESPTDARLPGKVVWHDLLTNDPAASKHFYGELFGWTFESVAGLDSDDAYTLIRHDGRLIGGMIDTKALNNRTDISQWVVVVSVEDVDQASRAIAANGGKVLTPPKDLQRRGRIAVVQDPEGAPLALLQTKDGDPVDHEPAMGGFLWDELWSSDVESAGRFYAAALGYQSIKRDTESDRVTASQYHLLKMSDKPRAGILANPLEELSPVWVSYLRVENPAAITARVEALGGRVLIEARPRPVGGEVAFIAGPSNAGIALQTWPLK